MMAILNKIYQMVDTQIHQADQDHTSTSLTYAGLVIDQKAVRIIALWTL